MERKKPFLLYISSIIILVILFIMVYTDLNTYLYKTYQSIDLEKYRRERELREFLEPSNGSVRFCAGFAVSSSDTYFVKIFSGRKICEIRDEAVYEDLRVDIRISAGAWFIEDLARIVIYSEREVVVRIFVEKSIDKEGVLLVLRSSRGDLIMDLSKSQDIAIELGKGYHVYNISILIRIYEPSTYIARLGLYFNTYI